jgi:hypothetical protein
MMGTMMTSTPLFLLLLFRGQEIVSCYHGSGELERGHG